jgi:SpoVK/Ycf46/Vps4 family AAA+-type ATPase
MKTKITNYVRAGYPGLYLVSHEESRVEAELRAVAQDTKYRLYAWSTTEGLTDTADGSVRAASDPLEALQAIGELPDNTLVLLRDLHLFLADNNPVLVRALKDALAVGKTKGKVLIILGCRSVLPPELEREFTVLDFSLPDKAALSTVLDGICQSAKLKRPAGDERDQILDAASGLTTTEAENAFALSVVTAKTIRAGLVATEKASTVKRNGLLELVEVREGLEDIGGLDCLKDWLVKRRDAFSAKAQQYGLPSPKGLLIVGIPGTGKSLTAKATASVFGRPLLKLDAGKLYGSLVGQSEQNLRSVIQTAEAIAPCVLWVDEIEKGLSGSKSSGSTDGGTSARVLGSLLSWLQEKRSQVFVVATANDVTQLPPELLRKGRLDEMFFVDLPNQQERETIWAIQITKYDRKPEQYDTAALSMASEGFTGSEIEQAVIDSLYGAFAESREPGMLDITLAVSATVPLSKLMAEQITGLRRWAQGRCRMATSLVRETKGRKIAA